MSRQAVAEPTYENVKQRLQVVIHDPDKITDELVKIRQAVYSREGFGASMGHIAVLREAETRYRNRVTDEDYAAIPVPALLVWTDHEPSGGPDLGERLSYACGPAGLLDALEKHHADRGLELATERFRAPLLEASGEGGTLTLTATGATVDAPARLVRRFGTEAPLVVANALAHGLNRADALAPVSPTIPATLAELVFGVTHEGATDVGDLLDRRTRVGLIAADRVAAEPLARRALETATLH